MSSPVAELVWTKLVPPAPRAGLIPRASLQSLLQAGLGGKLCLMEAPAGSGKTTLLAQWCAEAGAGRVAWVSLDERDNDPAQFWTYVVQALRTVAPQVGGGALQALRRLSVDLYRSVLPELLNDLSDLTSPLVLILDDYHLVTNTSCHQALGWFLDHLPAEVHVALSTRIDPPLPLARMRARGELIELRVAELQFDGEEASALLNGSMGLRLAGCDVELLVERTEGWAAGLVLAGLSLRGLEDPTAFIASFHGDNRHVADYLADDVLARQPEEIQSFLLRTSILDRLSGPLCDAVAGITGSHDILGQLERSNLFVVPLDDGRRWYRYHRLFAELLRLELAVREPALVPRLHGRAASWHQRAGHVDEAIHHHIAAGGFAEAASLVERHWLTYWRGGRLVTVVRWLEELPEEVIAAEPPLAFVAAWIGGFHGAPRERTERWLDAADVAGWSGGLPDGIISLEFGVALGRAHLLYDDVGRALREGRRALELAGSEPSPFHWMAHSALGRALYLSGRGAEARPALEELVRVVPPSAQPFAVIAALVVQSFIAGDGDDDDTAMSLARRAAEVAEAQGLGKEPVCGTVWMALGRALARQGRLAEADEQLERALELLEIDSMMMELAHALLLLAAVRRDRGDRPAARVLVERAHKLIDRCVDPGMLPALLERAEGSRSRPSRPRVTVTTPLTERELEVLRLLPSQLSNREISRELYVSLNTVRTHVHAIYRKLEVSGRAEAVERARRLHLIP